MKRSHVTVRISTALGRALERVGRARGVPKSQLVREAVANYLTPNAELTLGRVSGTELSKRWASIPHLRFDEAKEMGRDIEDGRKALPGPVSPWE